MSTADTESDVKAVTLPTKMKAVGFLQNLAIDAENSLFDFEAALPKLEAHDLLVKVEAISVNPVDTKVRVRRPSVDNVPVILGWDAAGTVVAVGAEVTLFAPGDEVFYAGALNRPGTNAQYHAVDERIVGRKPQSLSFEAAAALPLTTLTAYEMLFDRLGISKASGPETSLLIIGGAGGVGSIAIQLARQLTGVTVFASASRPESSAWVKELGAHHAVDHSKPLPEQIKAIAPDGADFIFSTNATDRHWDGLVETLRPQGRLGLIDDPDLIDVRKLKQKSGSLHWEFMFTRPNGTPDMLRQHDILTELAQLVDEGRVRTTATQTFGKIDAATLRRAHAAIESGRSIGKLVLEGF
jgi:zinc-binding alcohol dehydrogenase family protein